MQLGSQSAVISHDGLVAAARTPDRYWLATPPLGDGLIFHLMHVGSAVMELPADSALATLFLFPTPTPDL